MNIPSPQPPEFQPAGFFFPLIQVQNPRNTGNIAKSQAFEEGFIAWSDAWKVASKKKTKGKTEKGKTSNQKLHLFFCFPPKNDISGHIYHFSSWLFWVGRCHVFFDWLLPRRVIRWCAVVWRQLSQNLLTSFECIQTPSNTHGLRFLSCMVYQKKLWFYHWQLFECTLPETNIAHENRPSQKKSNKLHTNLPRFIDIPSTKPQPVLSSNAKHALKR